MTERVETEKVFQHRSKHLNDFSYRLRVWEVLFRFRSAGVPKFAVVCTEWQWSVLALGLRGSRASTAFIKNGSRALINATKATS